MGAPAISAFTAAGGASALAPSGAASRKIPRINYTGTAWEWAVAGNPHGLHLVDDFHAVGDDSTNNNTAFANAIAACASTRRPLLIPEGIFRVTTPITVSNRGIKILGAGMVGYNDTDGTPTSFYGTELKNVSGGPVIECTTSDCSYFECRDLSLRGPGSTGNTASGIYFHDMNYAARFVTLENLDIALFGKNAIRFGSAATEFNTMFNSVCRNIHMRDIGGNGIHGFSMRPQCLFENIFMEPVYKNKFVLCLFDFAGTIINCNGPANSGQLVDTIVSGHQGLGGGFIRLGADENGGNSGAAKAVIVGGTCENWSGIAFDIQGSVTDVTIIGTFFQEPINPSDLDPSHPDYVLNGKTAIAVQSDTYGAPTKCVGLTFNNPETYYKNSAQFHSNTGTGGFGGILRTGGHVAGVSTRTFCYFEATSTRVEMEGTDSGFTKQQGYYPSSTRGTARINELSGYIPIGFWMDATLAANFEVTIGGGGGNPANTGNAGRWLDQSGNGRHFDAGGTAAKWYSSLINGKPGVKLASLHTGSPAQGWYSKTGFLPTATGFSIAIVGSSNTPGIIDGSLYGGPNGSDHQPQTLDAFLFPDIYGGAYGWPGVGTLSAGPFCLIIAHDYTNDVHTIWFNGTKKRITGSGATNTLSSFLIGRGNGQNAAVAFHEFAIINVVIGDKEAHALGNGFYDHWGVRW
jgi:hypothetical protein